MSNVSRLCINLCCNTVVILSFILRVNHAFERQSNEHGCYSNVDHHCFRMFDRLCYFGNIVTSDLSPLSLPLFFSRHVALLGTDLLSHTVRQYWNPCSTCCYSHISSPSRTSSSRTLRPRTSPSRSLLTCSTDERLMLSLNHSLNKTRSTLLYCWSLVCFVTSRVRTPFPSCINFLPSQGNRCEGRENQEALSSISVLRQGIKNGGRLLSLEV